MELEESTSLTSDYSTKLQSSRQYGTGTKQKYRPMKQDSKRDTDVQNSLMDSVGEGEGGKIWENGIETCKISCMK